MKEKITIKQAKEIMRQSLIMPQPAPYIIGSAITRVIKRKITDKELGLIEARSFSAGREWV